MKVLNIVEAAYRGTLEEQDDTIVWFCHAMKGANADIDVLLRGNAVNYAVKAQDASGLSFGDARQTQPPQLANDLVKLKDKGVKIFVVEDALRERGIADKRLAEGVKAAPLTTVIGQLAEGRKTIWH